MVLYYIRDMNNLAERLIWAREQKGLTQDALAKQAGVSQSTIGNLESGIRQTARKIIEIAAALDVDPMWLANGQGAAKPSAASEPRPALRSDDESSASKVIQMTERTELTRVDAREMRLLTYFRESQERHRAQAENLLIESLKKSKARGSAPASDLDREREQRSGERLKAVD